MKTLFVGAAAVAAVGFAAAGCGSVSQPSAITQNQNEAQQQLQQLNQAQPVPSFSESQLRQNLIDIETIQAHATTTTTFFMEPGNPNPVWECTSVGLPIPSTDELTNPQQIVKAYNGNDGVASATIGQIDPTGVYSGDSTGTNVVCLNPAGQAYVVYWEGFTLAATNGATWDTTTHTMVLKGAPTAQVASK